MDNNNNINIIRDPVDYVSPFSNIVDFRDHAKRMPINLDNAYFSVPFHHWLSFCRRRCCRPMTWR